MSIPSVAPPKTSAPPNRKRLLIGLSLLVGLGLAGYAGAWWSENKYHYIPKRWGVVVPGKIFRSGQNTPEILAKYVKKHSIHTVIDMQLYDIHDKNMMAEVEYAKQNGITHHRFGLGGDGTGEVQSYIEALTTVIQCERAGEPVLVHCAAGTQRTGGVVACYRLLVEHASPADVYQELQRYDWHPKEDYELQDYLNRHLPEIAAALHERGMIAEIPNPLPKLGE